MSVSWPLRATDSQFDAWISSTEASRSCLSLTSIGDGTAGARSGSLPLPSGMGVQLNMVASDSSRMRHRSEVLGRLGHIHLVSLRGYEDPVSVI